MIVEEDTDAIEAGAPIDTLERYAAARGLEPERVSEDEFTAAARGSWGSYELRGVWRDEDGVLQFLAFPDIRVAEGSRVAIYEAIGLINETLWLGHFELWGSTGVVVYRHAAMIDGEEEPTLTVQGAELIVEAAIDEIDRFYPVFQFVLWGGKSPREALAAAMVETHGEA